MANTQEDIVDLLRRSGACFVEDGSDFFCAPAIETYLRVTASVKKQQGLADDTAWRNENALNYLSGAYTVENTIDALRQCGYFKTWAPFQYCEGRGWVNPLREDRQQVHETATPTTGEQHSNATNQGTYEQARVESQEKVVQDSKSTAEHGVFQEHSMDDDATGGALSTQNKCNQTRPHGMSPGGPGLGTSGKRAIPLAHTRPPPNAEAGLSSAQPQRERQVHFQGTNSDVNAGTALPPPKVTFRNPAQGAPGNNDVAAAQLQRRANVHQQTGTPHVSGSAAQTKTHPTFRSSTQQQSGSLRSGGAAPTRGKVTFQTAKQEPRTNAPSVPQSPAGQITTPNGGLTVEGTKILYGVNHPHSSQSPQKNRTGGVADGKQFATRTSVDQTTASTTGYGNQNVQDPPSGGEATAPLIPVHNATKVPGFDAANPNSFVGGLAYGVTYEEESAGTGIAEAAQGNPRDSGSAHGTDYRLEQSATESAATLQDTLQDSGLAHGTENRLEQSATESAATLQDTSQDSVGGHQEADNMSPIIQDQKPEPKQERLVDQEMRPPEDDSDDETEIEDCDEKDDDEISIDAERKLGKKRYTPPMLKKGIPFHPSKHYKGTFSLSLQRQRKKFYPECYRKGPYTYDMRYPPQGVSSIKYKSDRHNPIEMFQMTEKNIKDGMKFDPEFHYREEYTVNDRDNGIAYHPWRHCMPEYDRKIHGSIVDYKNFMVELNELVPDQFEKYQAEDGLIEGIDENGWPKENAYETHLGFMHLTEATSLDFIKVQPRQFREMSSNLLASLLQGPVRSREHLNRSHGILDRYFDAIGVPPESDLLLRLKRARSGEYFANADAKNHQDAIGFALCDIAEDTIRRGAAAATAVEEMMIAAGKPKDTALESLYQATGKGIGRSMTRLGDAFNMVEPISVRKSVFARGIQYNMEDNERLRRAYKGENHLYLRVDDNLDKKGKLYKNTIGACTVEDVEVEPETPPKSKPKKAPASKKTPSKSPTKPQRTQPFRQASTGKTNAYNEGQSSTEKKRKGNNSSKPNKKPRKRMPT